MSDPGQAERLPLDLGVLRSARRLRTVAALVVIPAAAGVAIGGGTVRWALAILAWIAALAWIALAFSAKRREGAAANDFLALDADGLSLHRGERTEQVHWNEVRGIDVDEETLRVRVERTHGDDLSIEPEWGGLGAYDLCERLERARGGAPRPEDG